MATHAPEVETRHRALREGAALLDRSGRGKLDVVGPDAIEYLQGQVTNDVATLEPGRGCYAALLNPKGRILADLRVIPRSEHELWLDTEADARTLLSSLEMYTIGRQVELADRTEERAILSLIGPAARVAAGVELPASEHAFLEAEVEGVATLAVATDHGIDLFVEAGVLEALRSRLEERGAVPVTDEEAEVLRIESGRARHGLDMTTDNFPGEVGIVERAVSFTKGCYVGQEPVARMHHRGHPNRLLRGLRLSEPAIRGEPVRSGVKEVGRVTSATVSPALGPIALALIRREVEPGAEVRVGETEATAEVIEVPFPKPRPGDSDRVG